MAVHFDPNGSILKSDGKMAGPMAEVKVSYTYSTHYCSNVAFTVLGGQVTATVTST